MAATTTPDLSKYKARMEKAVGALRDEFASLRTGRASASLLDQVQVEAYGARMHINQVGAVTVPDPRTVLVNVWDKGVVVSVEKAIRASGLGLNPVVEGQNLRIPIPPLTEERRRELAKLAGRYAEQQRVAVRNVRREAMEELRHAEKQAVITQDDHRRLEHDLQKLTDEAVGHVDETLAAKEQEIMQI
ncbi:MAG TPA: ribosome recycling factor [Caulobacteraceae bacterium]|nr:ribosome recycling factor [Caulobacteraceae bacterium]